MAEKNEVKTAEGEIEQQIDFAINDKFITALAKQLEEKTKYGLVFPEGYNVSNALMGAYLMLKETTDKKSGKPLLEVCTRASIANSMMDMVTLGLYVQKKQGYFINYGGKCAFQKSVFGDTAIARRYGMKDVNAEVIYEGDAFSYRIEDGVKVLDKHEQDFRNIDNGKIVGAYAVVIMKDGAKKLEVMNINQIRQAWKQNSFYKENDGTHGNFPDQMAKKTVIKRALKTIVNTYGDAYVQSADDRAEYIPEGEAIAADVAQDIEENANRIEFVAEPAAIEERPMPPTVAEMMEPEVPEFMAAELEG